MPNLDFYAVDDDLRKVMDIVFAQPGCRVFESHSAFGRELVEFTDARQLNAMLDARDPGQKGGWTLLRIVPPGAMDLARMKRIALKPEHCDGHTFRYGISGWGLIDLHIGGQGAKGLVHSHFNHNSHVRARAWQATYPDLGDVEDWDWKAVASLSSAINRAVRKLAVGKIGSRPVLPQAQAAIAAGCELRELPLAD